jgi:hypothetical protein
MASTITTTPPRSTIILLIKRRKDAKPKNAKTNCSGYNRRNKKRGRPRKRWKDEVEEDLNIMGIKNGRAATRERRKWREIVLQAKVHNGL